MIIQYRGQRLLAQSIIPGILNNSDMASLAEYGTVDEQKTINFSQPFHDLISQFAEKMFIATCKVEDKSGNQVEIAGSVEIKGIRGTDKRAYLVDLQGIIPRDANYMGEENHTCLVRQELTILYQRHLANNFAKEKIDEHEKVYEEERKEAIKKIVDGKEEKDLTDAQKHEILACRMEFQAKRMQKYEELIRSRDSVLFNANVFKNVKLVMSEEEQKAEEQKVRDLAIFLNEHAMPNLIKHYQKNDGTPSDSAALSEFFH